METKSGFGNPTVRLRGKMNYHVKRDFGLESTDDTVGD